MFRVEKLTNVVYFSLKWQQIIDAWDLTYSQIILCHSQVVQLTYPVQFLIKLVNHLHYLCLCHSLLRLLNCGVVRCAVCRSCWIHISSLICAISWVLYSASNCSYYYWHHNLCVCEQTFRIHVWITLLNLLLFSSRLFNQGFFIYFLSFSKYFCITWKLLNAEQIISKEDFSQRF